MSDEKTALIHSEAVATDREIKKQLVVDTISSHCSDSPFEDLRLIGEALQGGDVLVAQTLSGGWTNFSYRVYLKGNPEQQIFAKVAFERALWNPDPTAHHDLKRVDNEFEMMGLYQKIAPGCVAVPYLCLNVDNMKILVTQWSIADEQFANQFIDGVVDVRIIPKLAAGLAKLNSVENFDPNYGYQVRATWKGFYAGQTKLIQSYFEPDSNHNDRVSRFAHELGSEACLHLADEFLVNICSTSSLAHSDTHVFNILVEKKPDVSTLEHFGPLGLYAVCDWEMAMSCSLGRDAGLFYPFPLACVIAHAMNGNKQIAVDMLSSLDLFWSEYSSGLMQPGKMTDMDLRDVYKTVLGQIGSWMFFIHYSCGYQVDFLPLEAHQLVAARETLGFMGLHCMNLGFGKESADDSLDDLHSKFMALCHEEIDRSSPVRPSRRFMRSSMLRESGIRVSDAGVFAGIISSTLQIDED